MANTNDLGLSANAVLLDRAITHAAFLEGYKRAEADRVISFLALDVFPDLQTKLEGRLATIARKGFDSSPATTKRLRDFSDYVLTVSLAATGKIESDQRDRLKDLAKAEASGLRNTVLAVVRPGLAAPMQFDFIAPPIANLNAIVTSRPFEGRVLKDWWAANGHAFAGDVDRQVKIGLVQGETADQITKRIFGLAGKGALGVGPASRLKHNAETITISAIANVSNAAREESFKLNARLAKGVMIVAVFDLRTTEICRGQHGKVYPIGVGPRPIFHMRCRTTTTLVMKSAKELGLKVKGKGGDPNAPGTQSSLDGLIAGDTTQDQWLRRQSDDVQNFVFKGPGRADVFRRGKLKLEQFSDEHGRPLTLKELLALEKAQDDRLDPPPAPPKPPSPPPAPTPKPTPVGAPAPEPLPSAAEVRSKLEALAKQHAPDIAAADARLKEAIDAQNAELRSKPNDTRTTVQYFADIKRTQEVASAAADAKKALLERIRPIERATFAIPVEQRIALVPRNPVPTKLKKSFSEGKAFVESVVRAPAPGAEVKFGVDYARKKRAFYDPRANSVHLVSTSPTSTAVHEIGHAVETNSGWIPKTREFLFRRAAGERAQLLMKLFPGRGYGRTERAFKDRFEDAYVGKDYGDLATEVVSMGLQYLWQDPARFAAIDADFFDFILNLVRGTS